ncbi:MAG: 30S ribosomal protein S4 [Candidatus Woesearchaeota archaeon]|nr:MAG: 30S ribosomal protein S4 [Candidatus Woesearchaeota archaeon]
MGDPRKHRKKYKTPKHPWEAVRLEEEGKLVEDFGLVKKKEIWKMAFILKKSKEQAKHLIANATTQGAKEKEQLLARLSKLNLLQATSLDKVLDLTIRDVLERRLQTFVYRKGLAKSMKQSRQFILHGHIAINGRKMTVPSYLVKGDEEGKISFVENSSLNSPDNPERIVKEPLNKKIEQNKKQAIEVAN